MNFLDFILRFMKQGGDIARIQYQIDNEVADRDIRQVIEAQHFGDRAINLYVRSCTSPSSTWYVSGSFLKDCLVISYESIPGFPKGAMRFIVRIT